MSYIFDALQKSEAERSGVDRAALAAATEVLQAAERQAAAHRDAALTSASNGQLTAVADRDAADALEAAAAATTCPQVDQFKQFQSLRLMIPPQSRLVCVTDKESLAAEKFRFLAVRLRLQAAAVRVVQREGYRYTGDVNA